MTNKCASKRATLSEYANGTWITRTVDNQTASPRRLAKTSGRQTAKQTVQPSHSHSELHKLRSERLEFLKERQRNIWIGCIFSSILGVSLAFNIVLYGILKNTWL